MFNKGVMPPTVQANEGIRLAVCIDPDGLAISFAFDDVTFTAAVKCMSFFPVMLWCSD